MFPIVLIKTQTIGYSTTGRVLTEWKVTDLVVPHSARSPAEIGQSTRGVKREVFSDWLERFEQSNSAAIEGAANEAALTLASGGWEPSRELLRPRRVMDVLAGWRGVSGRGSRRGGVVDRVCVQQWEGLFSSDRATSDLLH